MLRADVRLAVGGHLDGVEALGARVVADPGGRGDGHPIVVCCFPGGGMTGRYFELDDDYDMAAHLASAGLVVVMIDHPGLGASDVPDDPWSLTPEVVADIDAAAVGQAIDGLRTGSLVEGLPALDDAMVIGLGHSMGAMLAAYQQARHRPFDGLVLLGHSGRGLPEVLVPDETALVGDAAGIRAAIVRLAQARFAGALPVGETAVSEYLVGPDLSAPAAAAIVQARGALLVCCGLTAMLSGSQDEVLAAIEVPVFNGVGEHDITGAPHELPRWFTGSADVTVFVLAGAFHNSNVATRRHELWDRIITWVRTVPR
jgi:alpha-beta hydrolase superfamily lysophospholipase